MATAPGGRALIIHHDANSLGGIVVDYLRHQRFVLDERWITPPGQPDIPGDFSRVGKLDPHDLPALIVVLGSGHSVYEPAVQHWVQPELDLLCDADTAGVPTLGICFGHQMLAAAHGATVAATRHPEIGWFEVEPESNAPIDRGPWFQWHLDHAELPNGAEALAWSPSGLQAFRLRSNIGVQFHPELDEPVLTAWVDTDRHWLVEHEHQPEHLLAETRRTAAEARQRSINQFDQILTNFGFGLDSKPVEREVSPT